MKLKKNYILEDSSFRSECHKISEVSHLFTTILFVLVKKSIERLNTNIYIYFLLGHKYNGS